MRQLEWYLSASCYREDISYGKTILKCVKEHLETFFGFPYIDEINILRIMMEQCAAFRSSLHLPSIDFDSVSKECIWSSLRRKGIPELQIAIIRVIRVT